MVALDLEKSRRNKGKNHSETKINRFLDEFELTTKEK